MKARLISIHEKHYVTSMLKVEWTPSESHGQGLFVCPYK